MDGITAAVGLIAQEASLERLHAVVGMMKQSEEATQGLVDMIVSNASSGTLYSKEGAVSSNAVGSNLNQLA